MTGPSRAKNGIAAIEVAEKQRTALELRKGGATLAEIAAELDYANESGAAKALNTALRKIIQQPAEDVLTLELERLDAALVAIWPLVKRGNLQAIDRFLRIQERRARYLGLDKPEKREITNPDGQTIQIVAMRIVQPE